MFNFEPTRTTTEEHEKTATEFVARVTPEHAFLNPFGDSGVTKVAAEAAQDSTDPVVRGIEKLAQMVDGAELVAACTTHAELIANCKVAQELGDSELSAAADADLQDFRAANPGF